MCLRLSRQVSISKMYFNNILVRAAALALAALLLTACGGGGGSGPVQSAPSLNGLPTPPAVSNLLSVTVDTGPSGTGYNVNRLYATVSICAPGSTTRCQTIDHVLVDTGSTGLRLLSSVIASDLNLSRLTGSTGFPLLSCVQFVDNTHAWGPVVTADVVLSGKTAGSVPIQIIADPAFNSSAEACSSGSRAISTATFLGANGILGVGLFREDCGSDCVTRPNNGSYYTCTDDNCSAVTGTRTSIVNQLKNPVPRFASDNNGVVIELPAVNSTSVASVSGSLYFGIGTQFNNQFTPGAVLTTNSLGYFTTVLAGQSLNASFMDTGSNGLYFDTAAIPVCVGSHTDFYCPTARTTLSATLVGANAGTVPVSFSIDNAQALFVGSYPNAVFPTLGGPIPDPNHLTFAFDWGLPFFYGRRVFIGIEGQVSPLGTGPFYAF